ncbi:MAG: serine--tRNA ligase, partial [Candidatus Lokiarchaeota archaeon]|nr:serine--tRNA ligase [Candidatus Lokiarchaeota archaeon]
DDAVLKNNVIDRIIRWIKNESTYQEDMVFRVSSIAPGTTIKKSKPREILIKENLNTILLEKGWINQFPGRGQWMYLGPYATLFRAIQDYCKEKINELGFIECLFPKMIHTDVMMRMKYFEGLPEGMFYVSFPEREPELFQKFKAQLKIYNELPLDTLEEALNPPFAVLAPAQCEPFYQFFSKQILEKDALPIKFCDYSGYTYRNEGGGTGGLERVSEFQRIETVYLGTPEMVEEIADKTQDAFTTVCDGLGLEWFVEVGDDPFYLSGRKYDDKELQYPKIFKREIRVKTQKDESISIGSVNVHGTHFVDGFKIKNNFHGDLWTGCTGFGVSRMVFVFLLYNGLDPKKWPEVVKKRVNDLPDIPKILNWP